MSAFAIPAALKTGLYIASIIGGEEMVRGANYRMRPSPVDMAEGDMRVEDRARARMQLEGEGFKQNIFRGMSRVSDVQNREMERQQILNPFNYEDFVRTHQADLGLLAVQTPPSPLEVYASFSRLLGRTST